MPPAKKLSEPPGADAALPMPTKHGLNRAPMSGLRGLTRMAEGFTLEYVKAERQLATFADQDYQRMYREQHHCHAIDVLAQALCKSPDRVH